MTIQIFEKKFFQAGVKLKFEGVDGSEFECDCVVTFSRRHFNQPLKRLQPFPQPLVSLYKSIRRFRQLLLFLLGWVLAPFMLGCSLDPFFLLLHEVIHFFYDYHSLTQISI